MLSPRAGALAAAAGLLLLLSACAPTDPSGGVAGATGSPSSGLVVVTAGGSALVDGQDDVPPTLDLKVLIPAGVRAAQVSAKLDGATLPLSGGAFGAVTASVSPMPLGSAHTLDLAMPGRSSQHITFHVAAPAGAAAAFFTGDGGAATLDVAFQYAPADHGAVERALPQGAKVRWSDGTHLEAGWPGAPGGSFSLPAGLATDRGSHLAAPLTLSLDTVQAGHLRRTAVPIPQPLSSRPVVIAFTAATAASRASLAAHADRISVASPTGIRLNSDGSLDGDPDTQAVATAAAHDVPVWPLIQNDASDGAGIANLLASDSEVNAFVQAAAALGYPGVDLDVEGVPPDSRDRFTVLVQRLAAALHQTGRKLAVAVVPHKPGHLNEYSAAYDLQAIAGAADLVTLMAYDEHTGLTAPGPVAGLDWDREVLAGSLAEMGGPATALLGLPLYSRAWEGGDTTADSYASSVSHALQTPGASVDYDFEAATPEIHYGDGSTLFFDDAQSLAAKAALVDQQHLRGVALWRLGFEDPAVWDALPRNPARP